MDLVKMNGVSIGWSSVQYVGNVIVLITSSLKWSITCPQPHFDLSLESFLITWLPVNTKIGLTFKSGIDVILEITLFANISPTSGSPDMKNIGWDNSMDV